MALLKRVAARLPARWQSELKRVHFSRQIGSDQFLTDEPEYKILHSLIKPGDWVIDIGANVGHYTKRFSELVGTNGRVIAFEPVPATFSLLAANAQLFAYSNVSLINAAASVRADMVHMSIPKAATGLVNYYRAHLSTNPESALSVLALSVDSLHLNQHVALCKIDAEGHEASVITGMEQLIQAYHPILIVETGSGDIISRISSFGYVAEKLEGSPNVLFRPAV